MSSHRKIIKGIHKIMGKNTESPCTIWVWGSKPGESRFIAVISPWRRSGDRAERGGGETTLRQGKDPAVSSLKGIYRDVCGDLSASAML
jgi:hypothetical protein